MSTVTDPQTVRYCDDEVRPACDDMLGMYYRFKSAIAAYFSKEIGSSLSDGSATVADSHAADGRTPITSADVIAVITQMQGYIALVEQGGVIDVLTKPSVNIR